MKSDRLVTACCEAYDTFWGDLHMCRQCGRPNPEMIEGSIWETWRLGGNIIVKGYIDHNDNSVVWFPEGATLDGTAALAIFPDYDEDWTCPTLWAECATLEQADKIMRDEP